MPFVSKSQIRWGHSPAGKRALGGDKGVSEWQSETPSDLPEKAPKKDPPKRGVLGASIMQKKKAP